ncbi:DUF4397 domain-containing protein [Pontibacter sp. Tf4]|uniref:DUF4397 domain-containing protein n=1 Tax=Pontibacter sp. Tf4 TaxID=2761620 RepID=UPI001627E326|nr:DUF4397 domain-containing protein [Pontibacter sp. Tf4]MBB6611404.1 DUF4397 domain-containing protein [Pontibacter sp. Tf4]
MKKNWMRLMMLAVLPAVMLAGCDDDGDDNPVTPTVKEANVMVVHASPDAPGVDLLVDNVKVNTSALTFPNNTGYLTVPAGSRNIKVNATGTSTSVIDGTVDLLDKGNYTIFATGSLGADDIEPLILTDDLTAPTAGNAKIRFVHLSPDAPAVDIVNVTDVANESVLADGISFRDATAFASVPAGTYNLEVRTDADGTVVLPVNGIVLESGKIYTVFARGFVQTPQGNTNTLGVEIIEHDMP